jgi:hypothetical protein
LVVSDIVIFSKGRKMVGQPPGPRNRNPRRFLDAHESSPAQSNRGREGQLIPASPPAKPDGRN